MKCLLVDDDFDDQEIFSIALKDVDPSIEIVFANDGVEAINMVNAEKSFNPDIIFIDMNMPRMNGSQCMVEIRKLERLKSTPIYMYSTFCDPKRVSDILELGATDFIVKPTKIEELSDILHQLIHN
jgi:CheY-like chemotaxis protein